jgi:hypothetical protein
LVFVANRCRVVSGAFTIKSRTQHTKRKSSARYTRRGCTGGSRFVCCGRFRRVHCCLGRCGRVLLGIFRFGRTTVRIVVTCPDVWLTQRDHVLHVGDQRVVCILEMFLDGSGRIGLGCVNVNLSSCATPVVPEMRGRQGKTSLAHAVDGPVPIHALPRPRYRFSSRRCSPLAQTSLPLRRLGREEVHSCKRCLPGTLASAPSFLMSHVRLRLFPTPIRSCEIHPYPPPVVYVVKGPPLKIECRCDNARHPALGSLSITKYRLGERLVELADRVATPQKMLGTVMIYPKPSVPDFFRRRSIM